MKASRASTNASSNPAVASDIFASPYEVSMAASLDKDLKNQNRKLNNGKSKEVVLAATNHEDSSQVVDRPAASPEPVRDSYKPGLIKNSRTNNKYKTIPSSVETSFIDHHSKIEEEASM